MARRIHLHTYPVAFELQGEVDSNLVNRIISAIRFFSRHTAELVDRLASECRGQRGRTATGGQRVIAGRALDRGWLCAIAFARHHDLARNGNGLTYSRLAYLGTRNFTPPCNSS